MKFLFSISFAVSIIMLCSCSKEKVDENIISYRFLGKDWISEKSDINVQLFENVLLVNLYSINSSYPDITGKMSFAIHNPSIGTFDLKKETKHGFEYINLTDLPDLVDFTLADQSGSITITELDFETNTISFKVSASLSSQDIKNQPLNINIEKAPMKVKFKKVSYLKYITENLDSDSYKFDVDTIRINKPGEFYLYTWVGYVICNFNDPISLTTYTQNDFSPYFSFDNLNNSDKTEQEYEITFKKADNSGISAEFQAKLFYPNFGEYTKFKHGYFEMFTEN
jgi:hypothetical protein